MAKILTDEEKLERYKEAYDLLWEVFTDYQDYGEVLQDTTLEKIEKYFDPDFTA